MFPHTLMTDLPPGMLAQLRHSIVTEPAPAGGRELPGNLAMWAVMLVAACAAVVLCLHG